MSNFDTIDIVPEMIIPMNSIPPGKVQHESIALDNENTLLIIRDVLDEQQLKSYIKSACNVERIRGPSAYGQRKPRYEMCYSTDGKLFNYSNINHSTVVYPKHVKTVLPIFLDRISEEYGQDVRQYRLSHGIDIVYPSTLPGSGSIGEHSDLTLPWDMVVAYSLGQTRYFKVRRVKDTPRDLPARDKTTRTVINVPTPHNSLLVMIGPTFQKKYTHAIDKLKSKDKLGYRMSLNARYFKQ